MPAPQPNAEQCDEAASSSGESVASDGRENTSDSVTTNNSKEDATAAFNSYYKHQAISDDASALFAKLLPIAVRVNRSSPCAALCTAALTMRPAPVAGTYFVDAASELLAAFQEVGALARQELVSCVPPALLAAQPGDVVADLCAAPGMKALQLLDAVGSDGLVVASEVDRKRLAVLVRRGRRSTAKGAFLALCADARRFPGMRRRTGWKQKYDKVLCDVPCSGDGTGRKKRSVVRTWDVRHGLGLHALQLAILNRGLELLGYGGRLVYSTCSLNPIECEAVVSAALARHAGLVRLVAAPAWARDLSTPGLASWSVPGAAYGATREVFARFEDVSNPKKARVAATMFPPADGAPLALARRFLPSEKCDSGGFFVAIFERSAERRPPAAPRAPVPLPPEAPPAPPDKEGDWRCACGTNNFARRGRCFSCKKRRPRVVTGTSSRPPPLLARFGGDASILDAFCDAYGLSAATGFPVESAFLLKRPKRSLLVISSAALADLAISETWAAAADVGCALCEVSEEDASRWPLFDEGLDVLARCATRRRVALGPDRLLALLNGGVLSDFGGDGSYVVTSSLAVGAATGRVALGASVADGVASLSSSARLCEAVRCVVGAFL